MRKWMLCLAILIGALSLATAQETARTPPLILVNGEAQLTAAPDLVVLTLGVTTQGRGVAEAREQNASRMQAVIDAAKRSSAPPPEISTTRFTVMPQYDYQERRNPPRIAGYSVSNQVTVKLAAIDRISDLLDAALAAGATDIGNLEFTLKDPRKLRMGAYEEAVRTARSKALALALAAGVQLGPVHLIRESGGSLLPMRREIMMTSAAFTKADTPVESGEVTVQVNVEIQYEIRQ
jgi:uncharacterized protein YggE